MDSKKIATKIREYLREHGIKCSFVAEHLGIKNSTLSDVFSGKRKLQLDEYITVCKILEKPFSYFLEK